MKTLYCNRCSKMVGEMTKGKLKKDAVLLCSKCNTKTKLAESAISRNPTSNPFDMFGNLFGGGKR